MSKKAKFEEFLEGLKGNGNDPLIESIKKGFSACLETDIGAGETPYEEKLVPYAKEQMELGNEPGHMDRKPKIKPLAKKVLAVAKITNQGWMAFIDAVPGMNHENESEAVLNYGVRLRESVARAIFSTDEALSSMPYNFF